MGSENLSDPAAGTVPSPSPRGVPRRSRPVRAPPGLHQGQPHEADRTLGRATRPEPATVRSRRAGTLQNQRSRPTVPAWHGSPARAQAPVRPLGRRDGHRRVPGPARSEHATRTGTMGTGQVVGGPSTFGSRTWLSCSVTTGFERHPRRPASKSICYRTAFGGFFVANSRPA